jgi:SEL1 protein
MSCLTGVINHQKTIRLLCIGFLLAILIVLCASNSVSAAAAANDVNQQQHQQQQGMNRGRDTVSRSNLPKDETDDNVDKNAEDKKPVFKIKEIVIIEANDDTNEESISDKEKRLESQTKDDIEQIVVDHFKKILLNEDLDVDNKKKQQNVPKEDISEMKSPKASIPMSENALEISSLIRTENEELIDNKFRLAIFQSNHKLKRSFNELGLEQDDTNKKNDNQLPNDNVPLEFREKSMQQDDEKLREKKKQERMIKQRYLLKTTSSKAARMNNLQKALIEASQLLEFENTYNSTNVTKAIEIYHDIARQYPEDNESLYKLALIFGSSKFGRFNFTKSKHYTLLAAMKGNSESYFKAGYYYANRLVKREDLSAVKNIIEQLYPTSVETDPKSTINEMITEINTEEDTEEMEKRIQIQLEREEIMKYKQMNRLIYQKINEAVADFDPDALAVLHYFFGSLTGDLMSSISLGYRHLYGYGVPKSCETAAHYYYQAASLVKREFEEGVPPSIEKVRITDDAARELKQNQEDIMDYYQYSAEKGSASSQLIVGYAHMYGLRGMERNPRLAQQYFQRAADAGEPEAFAALGNMYVKGIGVPQNNETAFKFFKKGAEKGDANAQNGLGYMYLIGATPPETPANPDSEIATETSSNPAFSDYKSSQTNTHQSAKSKGFYLEKDIKMAAKYFNMSANQGNPDGQYNLAVLYLAGDGVERSYGLAHQYFSQAAQHGHTLARYHLGLMYKEGLGVNKNCETAVSLFKHVVEKASWLSMIDEAFDLYLNGKDYHTALDIYQTCAELGVEVAQSNVALMYDKGYGVQLFVNDSNEQLQRALYWYKRAAEQGNVEAYVKVGDYYYYGTSGLTNAVTPNQALNTTSQYEKSVYHYRRAADLRNAQAMFNLGIMHEHGLGLPQDFHLAKRYYDMAAETDPIATIPVYFALLKLYVHWGFAIIGDYIKSFFYSPEVANTYSEEGAEIDSNSVISSIKNLLNFRSYIDFFRNLTLERLIYLFSVHEDKILALLIGLLLFLIFVRYVHTLNMNAQQARQQRVRRQ